MYRVELKDLPSPFLEVVYELIVPNVPCGVERKKLTRRNPIKEVFLMYRVELKDDSWSLWDLPYQMFLMYRVELKDLRIQEYC